MREHIVNTGNETVLVKDLKSRNSYINCRTFLTTPGMNSEYKSLYGVADFTDTDDENLMAGEIVRMTMNRIGLFAFLGNPGKVVSSGFVFP